MSGITSLSEERQFQRDLFQPARREASIGRKTSGSLQRFQRSSRSLAGGVSSGLRRSARPYPLFFDKGQCARIQDVDGNWYIDYVMGWGPLLLGHAPREICEAMAAQLKRGFTFGAQHDLEFEVAEKLKQVIPCAEEVCFASTGTEIVQLALRLARAVTGRRKYLKFEGHYHGWADSVLVSYHPSSQEVERAQGQPVGVGRGQLPADSVVVAEWNNRESVEKAFSEISHEISAVICEPLLCNSGCIPPADDFLQFLREITARHKSLLIFDEVITGFRLALGGAQELYGVVPDLATYAKAVGAGTPFSVLAGKAEYMEWISSGQVVHAGTLNGNPLSLAAANTVLSVLIANAGNIYYELRKQGDTLRAGLERIVRAHGLPVVSSGEGSVFHISFMQQPAGTYRDTLAADMRLYSDFVLALLDEGILTLPDGRWYLSTAHTSVEIEATLAAADRVFSSL
jgi:glutamate-1-semialdehyde 2,1-aminomutase